MALSQSISGTYRGVTYTCVPGMEGPDLEATTTGRRYRWRGNIAEIKTALAHEQIDAWIKEALVTGNIDIDDANNVVLVDVG